MTWSYVNEAHSSESTNVTSHPITVPTGVQVGDILFLHGDANTSIGITMSAPAGWTALDINRAMGGSSTPKESIWYKVATASEIAGQSVAISTGGSSTTLFVAIIAWRSTTGVDPTTPIAGWAVGNTGTTQTTAVSVDASAVSVTTNDSLVVWLSGENTSGGTAHDTVPPTGFTEVVDTLPGVARGYEAAWETVGAGTNLGVLTGSVSPAGRSITWVVVVNEVQAKSLVVPPRRPLMVR